MLAIYMYRKNLIIVRMILTVTASLRVGVHITLFIQSVKLVAFSALTLLVGCQEGHLARKNLTDEVVAWLSYVTKCK